MASGGGAGFGGGIDDVLRVLQRGAHASVAGGPHAGGGVRTRGEMPQGTPSVLGGMAPVSDGGEEAPDRRADPKPGRHRRTVDRAIPWWDAHQQTPPPFRPAGGRYAEG